MQYEANDRLFYCIKLSRTTRYDEFLFLFVFLFFLGARKMIYNVKMFSLKTIRSQLSGMSVAQRLKDTRN